MYWIAYTDEGVFESGLGESKEKLAETMADWFSENNHFNPPVVNSLVHLDNDSNETWATPAEVEAFSRDIDNQVSDGHRDYKRNRS